MAFSQHVLGGAVKQERSFRLMYICVEIFWFFGERMGRCFNQNYHLALMNKWLLLHTSFWIQTFFFLDGCSILNKRYTVIYYCSYCW